MRELIHKMSLRAERDVVKARHRARYLAAILGFNQQAQIRLGTATSEMARNAFRYAKAGAVEFLIDFETPQQLVICVTDKGPGIRNLQEIYSGQYESRTGMGMGIVGTRRLVDYFDIQTGPAGTAVCMSTDLLKRALIEQSELPKIVTRFNAHEPDDPFEEVERQNQELLKTLGELRERQEELARVNHELEDTNRGVVALYAELDERAVELRRASDTKSSFLSNMSHEFRTPLNSILSLAHLLLQRMDGDLTAEQEKQVGYIQQSAQGLTDLVNDLLDLAKVEAGKIDIHPKRFLIPEFFGALRGVLKPLLQDNSVSLIFDDPAGLPPMRTDEGKVSQILRNFISNALKFTSSGEIRVSARLASDGMVAFSVSDTGIGIAIEDSERIFEEFTQIESAMQGVRKGTGLGLPLSRKLARMLGGDVTHTSELGVGSTFTATIPIVCPGLSEGEAKVEIPTLLPGKGPVLLVEDNRETAFLFESYVKRSEFGVIRAHSLEEARAVLSDLRPLIVILDVIIEGEPSWDLLVELQTKYSPLIPVVVVSVTTEAHKAYSLGAAAFLQKPVSPELLLGKLRELTASARKTKLLLIDDDEIARYVLRSLLPEAEFQVLEAASGKEGLEIARREHPDIVFLDLRMPDISGFDVLRELRSDSRTKNIPIVIHSSYAIGKEDRERLNYPAVSVFSKDAAKQIDAADRLRKMIDSVMSRVETTDTVAS
ncbi:MAG TPA: ATP-binding protein [Candidatus Angelobacter sp.]|nr:ATP-binding protein [Candidatus Angelobacter sp.]